MAYSFLANPSATADELRRWNLHAKKPLGQHFLVDDNIVGRILGLSEVGPGDTVLEVGPGIGTLTVALLADGADVVAIEKDDDLHPVIRDNASLATDGDDSGRLALLGMDAIALDADTLLSAAASLEGGGEPRKFVSNLPYSVAATLILEYLQRIECLQMDCVMVQAEVADRICARPGTKDYGAYTVKVRLLATPGGSFPVAPSCFSPQPRVMSKVLRLDRIDASGDYATRQAACMMADAAFYQRRKTIRNSMQSYLSRLDVEEERVDAVLREVGVDPKSRGEQHDVDEFMAMGEAFLQME